MKKINKKLLATYLSLDNEKANHYLAKLADEILAEIVASDDNDEIFKALEVLEEFVYKVTTQTIAVARYIFDHPHAPKIIEILDGSIEGKRPDQVAEKAMELLNKIRYIAPEEVVPILAERIRLKDEKKTAKAVEILKNFSKYDFNFLSQVKTYGPQKMILDFIKKWNPDEQLSNFEFVQVVTGELLSSSTSGSSAESMDTVTFHSGAVQPTEFLKTLRREAMDMEAELYRKVQDPAQKLRIVRVLEEAIRGPSNVNYGDDLAQMLDEDGAYLLDLYRRMLFDNERRLIASFAIADEIEKRLYWYYRDDKRPNAAAAQQLRREILEAESYKLFKLLAGDEIVYREEGGWDKAEQIRKEEIEKLIGAVERPVEPWLARLNEIADQTNLIGQWQFRFFGIFLAKLAQTKPAIAKELFDRALEGGSVKQFSANFLSGFREINRLDLWDDAVQRIITRRDVPLVAAIVRSLIDERPVDLKATIRGRDLAILKQIVWMSGDFAFLNEYPERNPNLHLAIINALMRNYERDPAMIEGLIVKELRTHPEYDNVFVHSLDFGLLKHWIDYSKFSDKGIDFLIRWLIKLPELDWQIQELVATLGEKDSRIVYRVFWGRIEHGARQKQKQKTHSIADRERYEAVPYHFSDGLRKFFAQNSGAKDIVQELIGHATKNWSTTNWDIGHLLQRAGYSLRQAFGDFLNAGDDDSLFKAVGLMNFVEGGELDLCMEIAGRTDNTRILRSLRSLLYATGIVSGEDGIARAYESKAEAMKGYLENTNPRIAAFAKEMQDSFIESAQVERKRVVEEQQLRKIEFEG